MSEYDEDFGILYSCEEIKEILDKDKKTFINTSKNPDWTEEDQKQLDYLNLLARGIF